MNQRSPYPFVRLVCATCDALRVHDLERAAELLLAASASMAELACDAERSRAMTLITALAAVGLDLDLALARAA